MGLRDRLRESATAAREAMGTLPADIDELRPDLRECVERIHPEDRHSFLGPYRSWGDDVETLPSEEPILAASPAVGDRGPGMLVLTSERLFFGGLDGRAELPLRELSVTRVEVNSIGTIRIFTDPSGDRYHQFGLSPFKKETRGQFTETLIDAIREASKPVSTSQPASAADELEKFAALRDKGIITNAEFEEKKRKLLS